MPMRQPGSTAFGNSASRTNAAQPRRGPSAQANYERYLALAKAKALAGDPIEAERNYQYAEHYHRLIIGSAA